MDLSLNAKCNELEAAYRGFLTLVAVIAGNAGLCWLVSALIGGNAFLSETNYEGPPTIEIDGEKVVVHWAIYEFSLWHSFFTIFSVPCGIMFLLIGLVERARLFRIRRILKRGFEECPKVFS